MVVVVVAALSLTVHHHYYYYCHDCRLDEKILAMNAIENIHTRLVGVIVGKDFVRVLESIPWHEMHLPATFYVPHWA